jgi:SAM-dependent methyltransferase
MYKNINNCRLCKEEHVQTVIDFGLSPLANSYPKTQDENENLYPLTVIKCSNCGHVQLKETIDPKILFSNYLYSSSDSPSLIKHFSEYAEDIKSRFYKNDANILEIGSNDGILLKEFDNIKFGKLIGIDPAENISERAKSIQNANIITDFFNIESATKIKNKFGAIDIICANNVFAHVDQLDSMMDGIVHCLADDGVFIFENAYLYDTIKGLYFDQVYHEHLQYYGIIPLIKYLASYKMEIFDIKRVNTQGGSFRIYAKKIQNQIYKTSENVLKFVQNEKDFNLYSNKTYEDFLHKLNVLKNDLQSFIKDIKSKGGRISCYGCPAKFALFSKFFELDATIIDYVVDDSPLKQGKFSPSKKIPIVNRDYFYENPTDYCIISVWNMAEAIINNNKQYKGKFIIPMPQLKII